MVGSLDYFDEGISGQVNVTCGHASRAAALPFTYAAAMERAGQRGCAVGRAYCPDL